MHYKMEADVNRVFLTYKVSVPRPHPQFCRVLLLSPAKATFVAFCELEL